MSKRMMIIVPLVVLAAACVWGFREGLWQGRFGQAAVPSTLVLSGNIEAHESVLSFKAVQSRIVELPFGRER